jgi:SAM-dependent methyltransferase/uncharacterized protein YbaR (Trm112 family)
MPRDSVTGPTIPEETALTDDEVVPMKDEVQKLVVCLECGGGLELEVGQREGIEILEGFFVCSCEAEYPIIRGVPRMLPRPLMAELPNDYPEFFARSAGRGSTVRDGKPLRQAVIQRRTQESFGYEWNWSADFEGDGFPEWFPEGVLPESVFSGRVGLEVGCGGGRHAEVAAACAKQHVATDFSRAVDVAFDRTRHLPNCHVIQADAFHLPFPEGSFDYVYCIGVLQHLHEPAEGFRRLARQPRAGGELLVNVYAASRPAMQFLLEIVRKVTTRLPHSVLRYFCLAVGSLEYGLFIVPWRSLKGTRMGRLIRPLVPQRLDEYTRHNFHTCITDWFDRLSCPVKLHYKRDDLLSWYESAGYSDVVVTPFWKAFWNGYGRRSEASIEAA